MGDEVSERTCTAVRTSCASSSPISRSRATALYIVTRRKGTLFGCVMLCIFLFIFRTRSHAASILSSAVSFARVSISSFRNVCLLRPLAPFIFPFISSMSSSSVCTLSWHAFACSSKMRRYAESLPTFAVVSVCCLRVVATMLSILPPCA